MFQEAPDSSLIIIMEEPHIDSATSEKLKLIMEGADTFLPVKHTAEKIIRRTPFFITSNHELWKWCTQNKAAFEARMYHYNLSPISVLKNITKKLNPLMCTTLFVELETPHYFVSLELSEDMRMLLQENYDSLIKDIDFEMNPPTPPPPSTEVQSENSS